jgi:hypothetical protein
MPVQTSVQNSGTIRLPDGCKVEYGADVGSLVDVGAIDGDVSAELTYDVFKVDSANAGTVANQIKNMVMNLSFNLMEVNLENIANLSGGMATTEDVAGSTVSGATQTVTSGNWAYNKFILIENQNGDGSAITVNSVSGGTDGTLTEDTDYYVGQNEVGEWGIFVIDSTNVTTTSQDLTIDYDYTPNSGKKLNAGTSTLELTGKVVRFTHTDENSKKFQLTVWSAKPSSGFTLTFPAATNDTVMTVPISLEGQLDTSRADGKQLFELLDEQGV